MRISSILKLFIFLSFFLGVVSIVGMAISTGFVLRTVLVTVSAVSMAVTGFIITHIRLRPINDLIRLVDDVKNGIMHVNIDRSRLRGDEIGILINGVYDFVQVNRNLIGDLNKLSYEHLDVGNVGYRIDVNKYNNAFREIMERTNRIVDIQSDDINISLAAFTQLAEGNFNLTVPDMPGKKAVLPKAIRAVASNLQDLYEAAVFLAGSAADGRLDVQSDASKFKGNWAELVRTLNNLVATVNTPLKVISISMEEMKNGNLNLDDMNRKIATLGFDVNAQNYKGVFGDIVTGFGYKRLKFRPFNRFID